MKKIFVSSWFFPPNNSAEGIVSFKLLKKSKYNYDVYSYGGNDKYSFVPDSRLKSKNINVIESQCLSKKGWVNEGVAKFNSSSNTYKCIMSRCMPVESNILALKIKKKNKDIPWIASISDPLANSPYTKLIDGENPYKNNGKTLKIFFMKVLWDLRRLKYRLTTDPEKLRKRVEKQTFKYADVIILNNKYQEDYILKRYEKYKNKVYILPHSYDEDLYEEANKFYKDKKVISYVGHLDEYRNANAFLQALNKLRNNEKNLNDKLEIRFYGNISNEDKLYILNNNLQDIVKILEPVTYIESLKIMKQSDYLLSIDADLSKYINKNIFFPSKIADYIGSKTKILSITMDDSILKEILEGTNSLISNYNIDSIYKNLKLILTFPKKNDNKSAIEKFNNKVVSSKLDNIIDKI